ncbi:hypothetical protein [Streptomyces sp. NPDC050759]|uniref:hypothetical protein n=1 Tax=Streptomyces sp. NPDC050759 TaxID=3365635 RepID=UPI0037B239D7
MSELDVVHGLVSNVHPGCIETPLMASANPVLVRAHLAMKPSTRWRLTNALDGA